MSKICPKCNKEWPDEFIACPLDGTQLVSNPQQPDGFNLNLGDASAVSGGINMSDNHSVSHNSVSTTTHTVDSHDVVTNNIMQVEREKRPEEVRLEKMKLFRKACQDVFRDGVQTSEEKRKLDELQFQLGIDEETAAHIVESVRTTSSRKSAILGPVQQITFNNIKTAVLNNRTDVVNRLLPQLKAMVQKFSAEDIQYTYYMLKSIMTPGKCVEEYEQPHEDKYWQTFWTSVAYRRIGNIEKSEILVVDVGDKWIDTIPQGNAFVLATINALIDEDMETAKNLYDQITGDHSELLSVLVGCIYPLIYHDLPITEDIKKMALTGKFYSENLFKSLGTKLDLQKKELEDAKRKAEEELTRQKAEEEERRCQEEERKRKEDEERKRKEEAEERKRKEEEQRHLEEEERVSPPTRFCPQCGKEVPATAAFCRYCGHKLSPLQQPSSSVAETISQDYVDLGLPSGTLWKKENEEGFYTFDEAVTRFGDNLPTKEQLEEIINKCRWEWDWGNAEYTVTGINGNAIILPATGRKALGEIETEGVGLIGDYWSSHLQNAKEALYLYFFSESITVESSPLNWKSSVRLVK